MGHRRGCTAGKAKRAEHKQEKQAKKSEAQGNENRVIQRHKERGTGLYKGTRDLKRGQG